MLHNASAGSIKNAILKTLAYSDVFDYPLRPEELHYYLEALSITADELTFSLQVLNGQIGKSHGFYFLRGREEIINLRVQREQKTALAFKRAWRYGRLLGYLPFIRMVGLTGSLAVRNCDDDMDLDFMLVTQSGRVWLARAFALLLGRFARLFGDTLCPNLIISEHKLAWAAQDLYNARELCQMIPIAGGNVYAKLRKSNNWTNKYLPNSKISNLKKQNQPTDHSRITQASFGFLQSIFELFLSGRLGDLLESWEMKRKVARFTRQTGYGSETVFNADICQGNFDHHGTKTREGYRQRLLNLNIKQYGFY